MEILTEENLVGAKNCSHCNFQDFHSLTRGNHVSLVRIHFSHPADGKSSDVGVGGRIGILKEATVLGTGRFATRTPLGFPRFLALALTVPAAAKD